MRILIVASYNSGRFAPFITEQADALRQTGCTVDFFGIVGKGAVGYLGCLGALKRKIRDFNPDIVHAHYGLSGLLATLQHAVPVVITYHGSDLNESFIRLFSRLAMRRAAWNIRVFGTPSKQPNESILPCGVDLPSGNEQPSQGVLLSNKKHILFAGAFDNPVKDYPLAKASVNALSNVQLIELKGFTREQVYGLMHACDSLLLTSKSEGSPQVIKEAMACGLPIVSTNVGDVAERLKGLDGCFVATTRQPEELTDLLRKSLDFNGKTAGRERIVEQELTNDLIAQQLLIIYNNVLCNNHANSIKLLL